MAESLPPALCSFEEFLSHEYDFLIVGGGTAGLVVAARLTENPEISVGILEAGPAHINDPFILTPALYSQIIGNPEYDWLHKTVPQRGLANSCHDQPRGKGLGGSSGINFQMYSRGQASDYDDWSRLGNAGWDFRSLFPYFKKHENFTDPSVYAEKNNIRLETTYDTAFHGNSGPIHTSFSTWRLPQEKEWTEASLKLGSRYGSPKDGWSGDHIGVFHSLSTIDRSGGPGEGTRSYSVTGYLLPNASRPNLHVLPDALVTRLTLSQGDDPAVVGLAFEHSGKKHEVNVKKEVILSAGTYKSPQILELSGIGNSSILSKHGIEPRINNSCVGENLQDHPLTAVGYEFIPGQKSLDMFQNPATLQAAQAEYMEKRIGPLSSGVSATGFIPLADICSKDEISSIQKRVLAGNCLSPAAKKLVSDSYASHDDGSIQIFLLPASLNLRDVTDQKLVFLGDAGVKERGAQGFCIGPAVTRPVSTGSVHIRSSDPTEDPDIDPAYLVEEVDTEVLARGLQIVMKMAETSPLKELVARRYWPDESVDMITLEACMEYVKGHCTTQYHPLGTCSMGRFGESAVDERLRVWSGEGAVVKGLRVVDASVIPLQVSGNIQSAVYAVAEKGSDLIKEDWKI